MKIKVTNKLWIVVVVLAVALMLLIQPQTTFAQEKFKLKFQATWPAGSTLYENFLMFAEQVKRMSGGRLEIETDVHCQGLFEQEVWMRLLRDTGFDVETSESRSGKYLGYICTR